MNDCVQSATNTSIAICNTRPPTFGNEMNALGGSGTKGLWGVVEDHPIPHTCPFSYASLILATTQNRYVGTYELPVKSRSYHIILF